MIPFAKSHFQICAVRLVPYLDLKVAPLSVSVLLLVNQWEETHCLELALPLFVSINQTLFLFVIAYISHERAGADDQSRGPMFWSNFAC